MAHETTRNGRDYSRPAEHETAAPGSGVQSRYPTLKPTGLHKSLPAIPINRPVTLLGSRRTARIHLNSSRVSKAHALIVMTPAKAYVCDLLSRQGTTVKGHAVKELELRDGDDLQIGDFKFQFNDPRPRQKSPPPAVEPLALQITTPEGAQRFTLEKRVTLIGRRSGSDVELPYAGVSTANTAIVRLDGFAGEGTSMCFVGWGLFDLGGKGTELNGRPVHKERIRPGDVITIGPAKIEVISLLQVQQAEAPARRAPAVAEPAFVEPEPAFVEPEPAFAEPEPAFVEPELEQPPLADAFDETPSASEAFVTAEDVDAINLDEDLTPEGMELDLLGGSHVMDAISEPEQAPPEPAVAHAAHLPATDQTDLSLEELLDDPVEEDLKSAAAAPPSRPRFEEQEAEPPERPLQASPLDEAPDDFDAGEAMAHPSADAAQYSEPEHAARVDLSHVDFDTQSSHASSPWQPAPPTEEYATAAVAPVSEPEGATARYTQEHQDSPAQHAEEDDGLTDAERFDARFGFKASHEAEASAEPAHDEAPWQEPDRQPAQIFLEPEAQMEVLAEPPTAPEGDLGIREGELDLDGAPAEPPPLESELVIGETEPTPQSALDLEPLAPETELETFEHAPAPALSDSAFALELEALTEEGGMYGPPPSGDTADDVPAESSLVTAAETETTASSPGAHIPEQGAAEPPSEEIEWSARLEAEALAAETEVPEEVDEPPQWTGEAIEQPVESPQWAPEGSLESDAPQDLGESEIPWEALDEPASTRAEAADPATGDADEHAHPIEAASAQSEPPADDIAPAQKPPATPWHVEHSTFSNTRSFSGAQQFAMPVLSGTESFRLQAAARLRPAPAPGAPEKGQKQEPLAKVPGAPDEVADPPVSERSRSFTASLPDDTANQPPRPLKVGFAGPVAEIEAPVARGAATPFSSRPVGDNATPLLDPSMVMPDEFDFGPSALVSDPPRKPLITGFESATSAPTSAPAVPEKALDDDVAPLRHAQHAPHSTNGAATNGRPPVVDDEQQARIDDFLTTVRGGVRSQRNEPANHRAAPAAQGQPPQPAIEKPIGSVRAKPDWTAAVAAPLDALDADEQGDAAGSRLLWKVPLLIIAAFIAAAGAAAGIWYGVQPTATVTMKLRYDFPQDLTGDARRAYEEGQRAIVLEDSTRQLAIQFLKDGFPETDPGFLEDVTAWNRFALAVKWGSEPDTLLLWRDVPALQRADESARLKAVATALFDRGGAQRAALEQNSAQAKQLEQDIERSIQQLDDLTRQIEEAVARLPLPRDAASDVAQEQAVAERIAQLDEAWSASSRQAVQIREQIASIQHSDPLADDSQLAELNRRLTDIEAQMAIFRRRAPQGDDPPEPTDAAQDIDENDAATDLEAQLPAAALFHDSLFQDGAEPAAGQVDTSAQALPAPAVLLGPRGASAPLQGEIESLLKQAEAAAAPLAPEQASQLDTQVSAFAGLIAQLADEMLPAHVRAAGEVELLRQALLRTRRQRSVAMLEEDQSVRTLRAEAALKERELNAAISDGLTDRAAGLRMALRMTRDRLSMRVDEVTARLEDDKKVAEARLAYEASLQQARDALAPEQQKFEKELAAHRSAAQGLVAPGAAAELEKAMNRLQSAARARVSEQAARLPLLAEIWAPAPTGGDQPPTDTAQPQVPADDDQQPDEELSLVYLAAQEPPIPSTQPSLQEQAGTLRQLIASREDQLRQEQATRLGELREQLAAAEAAAAKAQRDAQEARGELAEMRAGQDSAITERQRVSQLRVEKVDLQNAISHKQRDLKRLGDASGMLVTPRPPADVDLVIPAQTHDPRPRLIMIAMSIIATLTLAGLFLTLRASARA